MTKHAILNLRKKIFILEYDGNSYKLQSLLNKLELNKPGNLKFICKGSEITEEIASGIVNSDDEYGVVMYQNYRTKSMTYFDEQITALESFKSAIEANGFHWLENPYQDDWDELCIFRHGDFAKDGKTSMQLYFEAEEKTFRNCLLFEIL